MYKSKNDQKTLENVFTISSLLNHCTFSVGLPLELSQQGWIGSLRIAGLYMAGVIVGSLGASVVEAEKYLVGASGGVYALIFAHLATLILNWKEDGIIYQAKIGSQNDDGLFPMELNPW